MTVAYVSEARREGVGIGTDKIGLVSEAVVELAPLGNRRAEENELSNAHCCLGPSTRASLICLHSCSEISIPVNHSCYYHPVQPLLASLPRRFNKIKAKKATIPMRTKRLAKTYGV